MKNAIILSVFIFSFSFQMVTEAAVIEGKLVSLDPLSKSIQIKRVNETGQEELVDIEVPDGVSFTGIKTSIAELRAGTLLAITVYVGAQPGKWVAAAIKQIVEPAANLQSGKALPLDPEKLKIILKQIESRKSETQKQEVPNGSQKSISDNSPET